MSSVSTDMSSWLLLGCSSAHISQVEGSLHGLRAMGQPPLPFTLLGLETSPLSFKGPEQKRSARQGCGGPSDSPDHRGQREGRVPQAQCLEICCRHPALR